jgi:hypothetical protein
MMEPAYMAASDNGELPLLARQIMYAGRPSILEMSCRARLGDQYFQTLLNEFIADNPEKCANWDVRYSSRGTFIEPAYAGGDSARHLGGA